MKEDLDFGNVNPIFVQIEQGRKSPFGDLLRNITQRIYDDPYLNFMSALGPSREFLHSTLYELHRDRNRKYFKNFFVDEELYSIVKSNIEWAYQIWSENPKKYVKVTITRRGIIVYDNYQPNAFNMLMFTIHSGTWMRKAIGRKQTVDKFERYLEEDVETHQVYGELVLRHGGILIDNKTSRFECDYNRQYERAIYSNYSEPWILDLWKEKLTDNERKWILEGYKEFYYTLKSLIENYRFNIIFDSHSMKDGKKRPDISFGTKHIPYFYLPIVHSLRKNFIKMGYEKADFNKPFGGGHILNWLSGKFPDVFTLSMEVNKKLYMTSDRRSILKSKLKKLSSQITNTFSEQNGAYLAP